MSDLKIISANCQGLRDKLKRTDVCEYLNNLNANIICLQDTHLTQQDENDLKNLTNCECIINGAKSNSRGVVILLKNNFEYEILHTEEDCVGNYVLVDLRLATISVRLINIYATNKDEPAFFQYLRQLMAKINRIIH